MANPQALQHLLMQLKQRPQVDLGQLDQMWVKRLYYLIAFGQRVTYALALLFSIGVLLIIGNTIRLTTQSHKQEIMILKLIGATHAFIRRPFLYRGLLYGFFASILAWILVSLFLWWLEIPAQALANSYDNAITFQGLSPQTALIMIIIACCLGTCGAWLAARRHFRSPEYS